MKLVDVCLITETHCLYKLPNRQKLQVTFPFKVFQPYTFQTTLQSSRTLSCHLFVEIYNYVVFIDDSAHFTWFYPLRKI